IEPDDLRAALFAVNLDILVEELERIFADCRGDGILAFVLLDDLRHAIAHKIERAVHHAREPNVIKLAWIGVRVVIEPVEQGLEEREVDGNASEISSI